MIKYFSRFYCLRGYFFSRFISFIPSFYLVRLLVNFNKNVFLEKNVMIHNNVRFLVLKDIFIGQNSTINSGTFLDSRMGLKIGRNVMIGSNSYLYTLGHNIDCPDFSSVGAAITIKDNVVIFPNSIIMPGVVIGEGAVVYTGSVVVKDVSPYEVVGGNPAKFIKKRNRDVNYLHNYKMYWGV